MSTGKHSCIGIVLVHATLYISVIINMLHHYKLVMTSVVVTIYTYFILLYCNLRIESYEAFVPSIRTNLNTNVLPEYSVELSTLQRS